MTTKQKIIACYVGIGVLFALYGWLWGDYSHKGFAYNLGAGLVWPIKIFPELGVIISTLIIVGFVAVVIFL